METPTGRINCQRADLRVTGTTTMTTSQWPCLKLPSNHAHRGMTMRSANVRYSADPCDPVSCARHIGPLPSSPARRVKHVSDPVRSIRSWTPQQSAFTLWTSTITVRGSATGQVCSGRINWQGTLSNPDRSPALTGTGGLIVWHSIRPAQVRAMTAGRLIWRRTPSEL
jgi:hypothetical protein